jgi:hypothetical protein
MILERSEFLLEKKDHFEEIKKDLKKVSYKRIFSLAVAFERNG